MAGLSAFFVHLPSMSCRLRIAVFDESKLHIDMDYICLRHPFI